ncbi:PadR family transcriptional regulator [Streptosporangium lutulentum]|uniref:DNA-binding PadR family transcriptional regulator n=1 Tax=Streptosporangium lutulentum TaxID=1461250 RepID=A0ABT9QK25_9ACTN|nr:PadR family transcriptional regulator [Streptosporangium lutulentum]MDP9846633.1 DNA-binding PadR family transcriptional regulator [Streptosporangium lutulentum]
MSLRIALLGLLTVSGPSSGYDLTKLFEGSINHAWQAGHSQIYPELNKMAADGLVTVEEEGPRGRKTYAITDAGSLELRRWLVEKEPSRSHRSEAALRAFLLPTLEPQEALALLRAEVEVYDAKLEALEALWRSKSLAEVGFGKYALDLGIRQIRTVRDWAADTAAAIESSGGGARP